MNHPGYIIIITIVLPVIILSGTSPVFPEDGGEFTPVYHPRLNVSPARGTIEIDGRLDDPGWRGAALAENFVEHNPGDQTEPEVKTEVMVTYDRENLYLGWLCYDNPEKVRASFCERDKFYSDDYVGLCLDTYGEATYAYEILSNPYGIPGDILYSSSNDEDMSYDMIFETAGRITSFGWVVEMAIPFASLHFPNRREQVWRVDFWRNRPRESRYQYSWAAYDRDESCWPCQWGIMEGISGVEPGSGFQLLPAVVAHQSASMNESGYLDNGDLVADAALGISYDISSELKAEVTLNPDFSQVEADAAQIDVNTTFALQYPEKRPFFQEGSDLFDTYFDAVYTRAINDPIIAGKLTWRKGPNSLALLTARDQHSAIIIPFEEKSEIVQNGKSYSNILRYKRDLGEQSHLGIIATDRRFDQGGSGSLAGIDGNIRLSPSNSARFQFLSSYTREVDNPALGDKALRTETFDGGSYTSALDGEAFPGHAFTGEVSRNTANYLLKASYRELSPTFRADNGMEPSNNARMGMLGGWGILRFDHSKVLETLEGNIHMAREWNFSGTRKDEWINTDMVMSFRAGQTRIHSSYMRSNELFRDIQFRDIWQAHTYFSTQPTGALKLGANINYGHRIARRDMVMGKEIRYGFSAEIKPLNRMLLSADFSRIYSDGLDSGERLFSQSILWTRLSLQISRELSLRLVAQYNDRFGHWDFDPLLSYRINSFTVFYIGSTYDYRETGMEDYGRQGYAVTDRQYFMKLQYLFMI